MFEEDNFNPSTKIILLKYSNRRHWPYHQGWSKIVDNRTTVTTARRVHEMPNDIDSNLSEDDSVRLSHYTLRPICTIRRERMQKTRYTGVPPVVTFIHDPIRCIIQQHMQAFNTKWKQLLNTDPDAGCAIGMWGNIIIQQSWPCTLLKLRGWVETSAG